MTTTTSAPAPADVVLIAAPLVEAIERAWAVIRDRNEDVPRVVVVMASGTIGVPLGSVKYGHFAPVRWARGEGETAESIHEMFVGGEGLKRGGRELLGTLLHEAAHGVAHSRELKDTSRQGRYHNKTFAALAEELGITVEHDAKRGWSSTTVPDATADEYAGVIEALDAAIRDLSRRSEIEGLLATGGTSRKRDNSNNPTPCVCSCPRKIRVAPTVIEEGPITCGVCGDDFEPEEA